MIKVNFSGGLGNQMFQYAFFLWLKHNYPNINIKLDLDAYKGNKYHTGFELKRIFNIPQKVSLVNKYNPFTRIFHKYYYHIKTTLIQKGVTKYIYISGNDPEFNKSVLSLNLKKNYYMHGVWNSPKYFCGIEESIKKTFKFDNNLSEENKEIIKLISSTESVSIHIRRGDYLNNTSYCILSETKYYENSLNYVIQALQSRGKDKNIHLFIFSDDPDWCKNNLLFLKSYKCIYVTNNTELDSYRDMQLMSLCKHNIIANSTFSWWAAWLNNNTEKIIICSKDYFIHKNYNSKFLIYHFPSEWIKI